MVTLLAKNALRIKCGFSSACMTGNYECAYALGILTAAAGLEVFSGYESIRALKEKVMQAAGSFKTTDDSLQRMIEMLMEYEAAETFDAQMQELYADGYADKKL